MHLLSRVPASLDPVAWFPMISGLDGFDPFGLFHPVHIRDIDSEREPVLALERYSVPSVGQHDTRIGLDRVQRNHLIELVRGTNLQMCGIRLEPPIPQ